MSTDHQLDLTGLPREAQLRRVLDDVLVRRAEGEPLTDDQVCERHVDLLPELASELRKLKVIGLARLQSLEEPEDTLPLAEICETSNFIAASMSRALQIRCPLCREPFELAVDQHLEDLLCICCNGIS